jgi:hypothetical protein
LGKDCIRVAKENQNINLRNDIMCKNKWNSLNSNFEKLEAIARAQVMIHVFGI